MESVMREAAYKIAGALSDSYSGFGNYNDEDHFNSVPEICDVETAAEQIVTKSNIIIFTGIDSLFDVNN